MEAYAAAVQGSGIYESFDDMRGLLQLVAHLLPQLGHCLATSDLSGQRVIERGQAAFLDGFHRDAEDHVRSREIFLGVIGRQGQPDVAALADRLPGEAFGQPWDQALPVDLELSVGLAFADQHGARFQDVGVNGEEIRGLHRAPGPDPPRCRCIARPGGPC